MQNVLTKKTTLRSVFIFGLVLFFSTITLAQRTSSRGGRFSIGAMALMGTGKMGNGLLTNGNAPDRDMLYTPIGLFMGFNFKKLRIGLNYEYMIAGQTTEPATVAGTNISGTGTTPGVRFDYYDGKNSLGMVYRLSTNYKLDKVTFAGSSDIYKATGGFSVQYMRQLKNKVGLVIDYTTEEFSDSLVDAKVKWSRVGLGVVFSNFSGGK